MKKILLIMSLLALAFMGTANAQNNHLSIDSLPVRHHYDGALPMTITDSVVADDPVRYDRWSDKNRKLCIMSYSVPDTVNVMEFFLYDPESNVDEYLYIFDGNRRLIDYNDDYDGGSYVACAVTPGDTIFIVVSSYFGDIEYTFNVDLTACSYVYPSQAGYTTIAVGDTVNGIFSADGPHLLASGTPYMGSPFAGYQFAVQQGKTYQLEVLECSANYVLGYDDNNRFSDFYNYIVTPDADTMQFLIVGEADSVTYSLIVREVSVTPFDSLEYITIHVGDTITDTIYTTLPRLQDPVNGYNGVYIRGYQVDLAANTVYEFHFDADAYFGFPYRDGEMDVYSSSWGVKYLCFDQDTTYRFYAFSHYDSSSYNFFIEESHLIAPANFTIDTIALGDTVASYLTTADPLIYDAQQRYELRGRSAKGYAFPVEAGSFYNIHFETANYNNCYYTILNSYGDLTDYVAVENVVYPAAADGYATFFMLLNSDSVDYMLRVTKVDSIPVFYVDAVNGDDNNDGTTAETPVADIYQVIYNVPCAVINLLSDYETDFNIHFLSGSYDIRAAVPGITLTFIDEYDAGFYQDNFGNVTIGVEGEDFTVAAERLDDGIATVRGEASLTIGSHVSFDVATTYEIFRIRDNGRITVNGVTIEGINGRIVADLSANAVLELNNVEITDCHTNYPLLVEGNGRLILNGGSWHNNTCTFDDLIDAMPASFFDATDDTTRAGIIAYYGGTVVFSGDFTTDAVILHSSDATLVVDSAFAASKHHAATIFPGSLTRRGIFEADYREGRQVLTGNTAARNCFDILQLDSTRTWTIDAQGRLSIVPPESIQNVVEAEVSVYPNPTADQLNVRVSGAEVSEAIVLDMQGRIVLRSAINGEGSLRMGNLPRGIYFLQLRNGREVVATQKVVRQ